MVPLLDLKARYASIRDEVDPAVLEVLGSGQFILGPKVSALEAEVAALLRSRHAIGVASGTDALELCLLGLGVGQGDEVIVPAFSFFATAEAVMRVGGTPVFADILPDTYCVDPADASRKVTSRTRALIPVHLYGHPADMGSICELAREHGLSVLEDNAQAFGARYGNTPTGGIGDAGCMSFYPTKNLGAYGDGGMVVTNDDHLADRVRMLGNHGTKTKYQPQFVGTNSRLDEVQAAVLQVMLRHLDGWNARRRQIAANYEESLSGLPVTLPVIAQDCSHTFCLYTVRVQERDDVQMLLAERGVASAVHYPIPLPLTAACRHLGYSAGDFPEAERASREALAIPIFPEMSDEQVELVASSMSAALTR